MYMFDSIIIGGGPAGASCALWLKQLGFEPCIVEKSNRVGGLQNVSPYSNSWLASSHGKTGQEVAREIHTNVLMNNITCLFDEQVISVQKNRFQFTLRTASDRQLVASTLVLATGVRAVSGSIQEQENVFFGPGNHVAGLEVFGQDIAILGGGDNAFENYLFLKEKGASSIKIFARSIRARRSFVEQVPEDDLIITAEFEFNQSERRINGMTFDKVLVMYGWEPDLRYVNSLSFKKSAKGFLKVDDKCRTSQPGIFAIGEVTQRMHPCCVTAMADGVIAAKAIQLMFESEKSAVRLRRCYDTAKSGCFSMNG
jgi:thioredoxin reductase (NADPH)